MNIWTQKSIELANQENYLDLLYEVYPLSANCRREMSDEVVSELRSAFYAKDNNKLLKILIRETKKKSIVFPVKDSYVAYLRHDSTVILPQNHSN